MPIRWSSTGGTKSPLFRAFLSTIAKSSKRRQPPSLPTSAKSLSKLGTPSTRSFQSTPPQTPRNLSTLASITKSIALAGTGTLTSTLVALYLATIVETAAHKTLYEYFPHKYYEIAEGELPVCLREKETRRRRTGEARSERAGGRVWDERYLSVDGWVLPEEGTEAELMEEELLEATMDENSGGLAGWQRRTTEKRERIIEREEREFARGDVAGPLGDERNSGLPSLWGESTANASSASSTSQLTERKKVQEEMAKKFQESLLSAAFTA